MSNVLIVWTSAAGEEHEERWPSVERFRVWAAVQDQCIIYSAYAKDDDGDFAIIDKGRL